MVEKQRPFTKGNGLQSHTSENACIIFPPRVVPTDRKDPTITLWRSVKRVMFNCLSPGSALACVLRNGLCCSSVVGLSRNKRRIRNRMVYNDWGLYGFVQMLA